MQMSGSKKCLLYIAAVSLCWLCESGYSKDTGVFGFEKYSVITERNIFSRYKRTSSGDNVNRIVETRKKILSLYMLRGVSLKGNMKLAFIEDEISGQYIRAGIGETVSGCQIKNIEPNQVIFERQGQEYAVKIGAELFRKETEASAVQTIPVIRKNDAEESADDKSGDDEILKKMMERRKTQLEN